MLRITKMLGLSVALCATPWAAEPADNASIQVSLTIRETCLIRTPDGDVIEMARPQVSCLHDTPHLARLMEETAATQDPAPSTAQPMPATWVIMF